MRPLIHGMRLWKTMSVRKCRLFGTSAFPGTSEAQVGLGNSFKGKSRFYKHVETRPIGPKGKPEGYVVLLDGRRVKTGRGTVLTFPTENLAYAISGEWARQGDYMEPDTMPLYGYSSISTQVSRESRELSYEHILGYLSTDTTCIRASEEGSLPVLLKQQKILDPIIEWFDGAYGAMEVTSSLFAPPVAPETVESALERLQELDDWHLTAVETMTRTCKSAVLALGVLDRQLTAEQALDASRLEEQHQIDGWGLLHNGHDLDINFVRLKMLATSSFLYCIDDAISPLLHPLKHSSKPTGISAQDVDAFDDLFLDDARDGVSAR